MNIWPLRFRVLAKDQILFVNDTGNFFVSNNRFLDRYVTDNLNISDKEYLLRNGHAYKNIEDLSFTSFSYNWAWRLHLKETLNYVMLVPTIRCNQSCSYCQASRATESESCHDWTEDIITDVFRFLGSIDGDNIKVEFQGGEPLLRVDILERVRAFCRSEFKQSEFVVCTNMLDIGDREWKFLESKDTYISTSIDGDIQTHSQQRTHDHVLTKKCFNNVKEAIQRFGTSYVSALPTIDIRCHPNIASLVETYEDFGFFSIYLRPVNYHGFAREIPQDLSDLTSWNRWYSDFIDFLIERNVKSKHVIEEFYFSHCLQRILRHGQEDHVNIRNPNLLGTDYILIDYDGTLFPTDESRMLRRIGHIDLSIGTVTKGIDQEKVDLLNTFSINNFDPDCIHCPYQPFCSSDIIDDISRYGRIDIPRSHTWFCRRQIALFDKAFSMMYLGDMKTQHSLARWLGIESWHKEITSIHL